MTMKALKRSAASLPMGGYAYAAEVTQAVLFLDVMIHLLLPTTP